MYSGYARKIWRVGAHLSHHCSVSALLSPHSPHRLFPFVYLSCVGPCLKTSRANTVHAAYTHTHTPIPHTLNI